MTHPELDQRRLDEFERSLISSTAIRVAAQEMWRALAQVFPHRTPGPAERLLLLEVLRSIEARGSIRLPPERGGRWDRSMDPAVPTSVDVVRDETASSPFPWRTFPWHPHLHWVVQCRSLSAQQGGRAAGSADPTFGLRCFEREKGEHCRDSSRSLP